MTVTDIKTDESAVSPQEIRLFDDTVDLLSAMGNHEAKIGTLLALGLDGNMHSAYSMNTLVNGLQSRDGGWRVSGRGAFGYCLDSLDPIGYVVKGAVETSKGLRDAYQISSYGKEFGIPLAGLLAGWSLRHPEVSLQQLLGPTQSKGERRAPETRVRVLAELITWGGNEPIAIADMIDMDPADWQLPAYHTELSNIDTAARALARAGIVKIQSISDDNVREFEVVDPLPPNYKSRSDTRGILYKFAAQRFAEGMPVFNFEDAFDYVKSELKAAGVEMDDASIRRKLDKDLGGEGSITGVDILSTFNRGRHTRIVLNDQYRLAVEELIDIVNAVEDLDLEVLELGNAVAFDIVTNPELMSQLMGKAKEFSVSANKRPLSETKAIVMSIISESEENLGREEITRLLEERSDRVVSSATIGVVLRALVKEGKLSTKVDRIDSSRKIRRKTYGVRPI